MRKRHLRNVAKRMASVLMAMFLTVAMMGTAYADETETNYPDGTADLEDVVLTSETVAGQYGWYHVESNPDSPTEKVLVGLVQSVKGMPKEGPSFLVFVDAEKSAIKGLEYIGGGTSESVNSGIGVMLCPGGQVDIGNVSMKNCFPIVTGWEGSAVYFSPSGDTTDGGSYNATVGKIDVEYSSLEPKDNVADYFFTGALADGLLDAQNLSLSTKEITVTENLSVDLANDFEGVVAGVEVNPNYRDPENGDQLSDFDVKVDGNVSVTGKHFIAYGTEILSVNTAKVEVAGSVKAQGTGAAGVGITSFAAEVKLGGGLEAKGEKIAAGFMANASKKIDFVSGKDVIAQVSDKNADTFEPGCCIALFFGNTIDETETTQTVIVVEGSVISDGIGIAEFRDAGDAKILVTDTIQADNPIVLLEKQRDSDVDLKQQVDNSTLMPDVTVWKIAPAKGNAVVRKAVGLIGDEVGPVTMWNVGGLDENLESGNILLKADTGIYYSCSASNALTLAQEAEPAEADDVITSDNDRFDLATDYPTLNSKIHYIIKTDSAVQDLLTVTKEDGTALTMSEKFTGSKGNELQFPVACAGEKLLLNVPEGYTIKAAYNGEGEDKTSIEKTAAGYVFEVPQGGGVLLSAEIEAPKYEIKFVNYDENELYNVEVEAGKTPEYKGATPTREADMQYVYTFKGWDSEIVPVDGAKTYKAEYSTETQKHSLTFDLGKGMLDGKTGKITIEAEYGSTIKIPGAPTLDGFKFVKWQGSDYYPGDDYLVEGPHDFTAVWEEDTPEVSPAADDKPESPKTADETNFGYLFILLSAAVVTAVLVERRMHSNAR